MTFSWSQCSVRGSAAHFLSSITFNKLLQLCFIDLWTTTTYKCISQIYFMLVGMIPKLLTFISITPVCSLYSGSIWLIFSDSSVQCKRIRIYIYIYQTFCWLTDILLIDIYLTFYLVTGAYKDDVFTFSWSYSLSHISIALLHFTTGCSYNLDLQTDLFICMSVGFQPFLITLDNITFVCSLV